MASEQYSYMLTETAEADVDEATDYIVNELHNPDAAAVFLDAMEEKLSEICRSPKTGRLVRNPYLTRNDIRRVLVKNYIAYYIVDETEAEIIVLRVVYGGRDQDQIVEKM